MIKSSILEDLDERGVHGCRKESKGFRELILESTSSTHHLPNELLLMITLNHQK